MRKKRLVSIVWAANGIGTFAFDTAGRPGGTIFINQVYVSGEGSFDSPLQIDFTADDTSSSTYSLIANELEGGAGDDTITVDLTVNVDAIGFDANVTTAYMTSNDVHIGAGDGNNTIDVSMVDHVSAQVGSFSTETYTKSFVYASASITDAYLSDIRSRIFPGTTVGTGRIGVEVFQTEAVHLAGSVDNFDFYGTGQYRATAQADIEKLLGHHEAFSVLATSSNQSVETLRCPVPTSVSHHRHFIFILHILPTDHRFAVKIGLARTVERGREIGRNIIRVAAKIIGFVGFVLKGTEVEAVAKTGHEEGCDLIGGSCIVAPTGEVVARCTLGDEVIVHPCDLYRCRENQDNIFNFAIHRQPQE